MTLGEGARVGVCSITQMVLKKYYMELNASELGEAEPPTNSLSSPVISRCSLLRLSSARSLPASNAPSVVIYGGRFRLNLLYPRDLA